MWWLRKYFILRMTKTINEWLNSLFSRSASSLLIYIYFCYFQSIDFRILDTAIIFLIVLPNFRRWPTVDIGISMNVKWPFSPDVVHWLNNRLISAVVVNNWMNLFPKKRILIKFQILLQEPYNHLKDCLLFSQEAIKIKPSLHKTQQPLLFSKSWIFLHFCDSKLMFILN